MTIGTVVEFRTGKEDHSNLYVRLKNGAIYQFTESLLPLYQERLKRNIRKNNYRLQLDHMWRKVR